MPTSGFQLLLERGRVGAAEHAQCSLADVMHSFLANAILTGSIAGTQESVRRDLASKDHGTRTKAEDSIIGRMTAALYGTQDGDAA